MRRVYLLGLSLLCAGLWACSDDSTATAPKVPPSFANGIISNACNTTRYPNYGGIWAVTLTPSYVQVDSSNSNNWLHSTGVQMEALVWRDWASSPGNQYYCVDSAATMGHVAWFENDPANAIGLLSGLEDPVGTQWPNKRLLQAFRRGTAHPYVIYNVAPTIRDTSTVVVVP